MDFFQAADWVRVNEKAIKGMIAKYRNFSPYEECDYMQDAFEAAMIAVAKSRKKGIRFEAAFWKTFRSQIGVVTPCPNSKTHGSNSVPSHLCSVDIDSVSMKVRNRRRRKPDIEAIYNSICHLLTEKERHVLYLALGIADEGGLSNYEIAERLGCVVSNVRDILERAMGRIKKLVGEGIIDPRHLRQRKIPTEQNHESRISVADIQADTKESFQEAGRRRHHCRSPFRVGSANHGGSLSYLDK